MQLALTRRASSHNSNVNQVRDRRTPSCSLEEIDSEGLSDGSNTFEEAVASKRTAESSRKSHAISRPGKSRRGADLMLLVEHIASRPHWNKLSARQRWSVFCRKNPQRSNDDWRRMYRECHKEIQTLVAEKQQHGTAALRLARTGQVLTEATKTTNHNAGKNVNGSLRYRSKHGRETPRRRCLGFSEEDARLIAEYINSSDNWLNDSDTQRWSKFAKWASSQNSGRHRSGSAWLSAYSRHLPEVERAMKNLEIEDELDKNGFILVNGEQMD